MPDSTAEYYRAKAEECETKADSFSLPEVKQQFLELAASWRQLARHAEHRRGGK